MKRARGSAYPLDYFEKGEAETLEAVPRYEGSALGFRLVSDAPMQVYRGGSWRGYRAAAGAPFRNWDHVPRTASTLGFRLAREGK